MSLVGMAQETLRILEEGGYVLPDGGVVRLGAEQHAAVEGTILLTPEDLRRLQADARGLSRDRPQVVVTGDKTQQAVLRLAVEHPDVAALNFASARRPGGGFLRGAMAQEEDLARSSGLYPCLLTQERFYETNQACGSPLYTDHAVFAPLVPWFRDGAGRLVAAPVTAGVISMPAPNKRELQKRRPDAVAEVEPTLRRRAGHILAIARQRGLRRLVLGAWGCGVFGNDPRLVADAFAVWLADRRFGGAFDLVEFAVFDPLPQAATRRAFQSRFAGWD